MRSRITSKKKTYQSQFKKDNRIGSITTLYHPFVKSDDESDNFNRNLLNFGKEMVYDDTFNLSLKYSKVKTNYLNIMVIGESGTGKFDFIKLMFQHCFKKEFKFDGKIKKFREFVYKIENGRRGNRVINFIHTLGFSDDYSMKLWYKNIKSNIKDRMESYDELRSYFNKKDKLLKDNIKDNRIHLCLFFLKSSKIKLSEMLYIQKLQKYTNIIPILIEEENDNKFICEKIKLETRELLLENDVEWFDLQEDDITFKQFRANLLAKTTPFLLMSQYGKIITNSANTDLYILIKMLVTPYINTYYYKTELLFNRNIDKIRAKKMVKTQEILKDKQKDTNNGPLSLGIALGIGFLGALVVVRNKIFE